MKTHLLAFMVLCMPLFAGAVSPEETAVKNVVQGAYIDGLQNLGDIQTIRNGFHPSFEMLVLRQGQLSKLDIASWIQRVEERKSNPATNNPNIRGEFVIIDVTGNVAMVKLELYRGNTKLFTDFISLYKFADGWKIVSKVYHQY